MTNRLEVVPCAIELPENIDHPNAGETRLLCPEVYALLNRENKWRYGNSYWGRSIVHDGTLNVWGRNTCSTYPILDFHPEYFHPAHAVSVMSFVTPMLNPLKLLQSFAVLYDPNEVDLNEIRRTALTASRLKLISCGQANFRFIDNRFAADLCFLYQLFGFLAPYSSIMNKMSMLFATATCHTAIYTRPISIFSDRSFIS